MLTVNPEIDSLRSRILTAPRVLIITGAGISADSGLPTYRGLEGLYNGKTEEGVNIEEALSGSTLITNPSLCWKYLSQIASAAVEAEPNPSHHAIAQFQGGSPGRWLLTQNIDSLHARAGSVPSQTIEIHGTMLPLRCMDCSVESKDKPSFIQSDLPPRCPSCSGVMRPNVVLFGEMLNQDACVTYGTELNKGFDVVIAVGTTGQFPYILSAVLQCKESGGFAIEINPEQTKMSSLVDAFIPAKAVHILPYLLGYVSLP